jgi:hypothetical protein
MPTDAEIEATQKLSRELEAKAMELQKQVDDPSKSLAPLYALHEEETARFRGILNSDKAPPGTGAECLAAAFELIGDWAGFEVAVEEGLAGGGSLGSSAKPASRGPKAAPRRGMRI